MIRRFCDACNKEIEATANRGSFDRTFAAPAQGESDVRVSVEVMVTINGATNGGDICADCIALTVDKGIFTRKNFR